MMERPKSRPNRGAQGASVSERYIAEVQARIAKQRTIIQNAIEKGQPFAEAELMLRTLEGSLLILKKQRDLIEKS